MDIFNEISWPQFRKLNHIRNLSLNEQTQQYNKYKYDLDVSHMNWIKHQIKGRQHKQESTSIEQNFLLQENNDFLLQENGFNLIIE